MTYDEAEIGFAVTNVMEPELSYLLDEFHKRGGKDSLSHFMTWLDLLRDKYL